MINFISILFLKDGDVIGNPLPILNFMGGGGGGGGMNARINPFPQNATPLPPRHGTQSIHSNGYPNYSLEVLDLIRNNYQTNICKL